MIHFAIAAGVTATLAYLGYRDQASAVVLSLLFGAVAMIIQLTFLDLAARACPQQAEATFFAFLMSVYNGAVQLSQITGGWLYDQVGFTRLIFISSAFTALCWLLVPLLKLDELQPVPRRETPRQLLAGWVLTLNRVSRLGKALRSDNFLIRKQKRRHG